MGGHLLKRINLGQEVKKARKGDPTAKVRLTSIPETELQQTKDFSQQIAELGYDPKWGIASARTDPERQEAYLQSLRDRNQRHSHYTKS